MKKAREWCIKSEFFTSYFKIAKDYCVNNFSPGVVGIDVDFFWRGMGGWG